MPAFQQTSSQSAQDPAMQAIIRKKRTPPAQMELAQRLDYAVSSLKRAEFGLQSKKQARVLGAKPLHIPEPQPWRDAI